MAVQLFNNLKTNDMKKIEKFKKEFNAEILGKMPVFEIEVLKEGEKDYILFNIAIVGRSFIAQHESLTKREAKSKKIAFKKWVIDTDFSVSENLQELYEECQTGILESDFFTLI